jgi:hypothetical protein
MSHLLIVQSSAGNSSHPVFEDGLTMFSHLFKLRPADSVRHPTMAISVFPRLKAKSCDVVRSNICSTQWIVGIGTWFYQGESGEAGLRKLLDDPRFTRDLPDECLQELDGQYVLAYGDCESGELVVITDRLGISHIYAANIGPTKVFSTSSLILAALVRADWDPEGCRQFIASGNIFEPSRSLFKGVKKLEDARIYRFVDGEARPERRYWSVESVIRQNAETPIDVPQINAALQNSLRLIQRNFHKPIMDFTGGFDTRGLVGAMLTAGLHIDVVVNGPDECADVVASTRIAQGLGLKQQHRFSDFCTVQQWWDRAKESLQFCDGECDLLYYAPTLECHVLNSDGFDCSINGAIGEVLKGHWWELLFPRTGSRFHFDARLIADRRFVFEGEAPGLLAFTYSQSLTEHMANVIRQTIRGMEDLPNTVLLDTIYLVLRQQKWLGRAVSATDRIWPCLSPYGFKQPMELAILAPVSSRLRHRMSRRLIEYQDKRLATLPLPGGFPASPMRLRNIHQFGPVLRRYTRLVARRLLIQAKLKGKERTVKNLYPHTMLSFRELVQLQEVHTLLNPKEMYTKELYNPRILQTELDNCLTATSTNAYRLPRILTLEFLARTIRTAPKHASH